MNNYNYHDIQNLIKDRHVIPFSSTSFRLRLSNGEIHFSDQKVPAYFSALMAALGCGLIGFLTPMAKEMGFNAFIVLCLAITAFTYVLGIALNKLSDGLGVSFSIDQEKVIKSSLGINKTINIEDKLLFYEYHRSRFLGLKTNYMTAIFLSDGEKYKLIARAFGRDIIPNKVKGFLEDNCIKFEVVQSDFIDPL